jgi:acetyl esterase/lipase
MEISLSGAPCAFSFLPSIEYGRVPGAPEWEAPLYLDLLVPTPLPAPAVPAVLYMHGGGWRAGTRREGWCPWLSPLLAAHGFIAVNVSYRLTDRAPFPAQLHDVKAAVRFLRAHASSYGIDADRIGVWGDSAGGQLAALLGVSAGTDALEGSCGWAGHSSAVQAVVSRSAPGDFEWALAGDGGQGEVLSALFGGPLAQRPELVRLAGPVHHVRPGAPPFLIVHGTRDETVPFASAERFATTLGDAGVDVTFHRVEGGHHNLLPDELLPWADEPWTDLGHQALAFFDRHLRK